MKETTIQEDNRSDLGSDLTAPLGSYKNPVRYPKIDSDDPDRDVKRAAQRAKFTKDAGEGKILCLTDLFISHGI